MKAQKDKASESDKTSESDKASGLDEASGSEKSVELKETSGSEKKFQNWKSWCRSEERNLSVMRKGHNYILWGCIHFRN